MYYSVHVTIYILLKYIHVTPPLHAELQQSVTITVRKEEGKSIQINSVGVRDICIVLLPLPIPQCPWGLLRLPVSLIS